MTITFSHDQWESLQAAKITHDAVTQERWGERGASFETHHVDPEFIRSVHTFASQNSREFNGILQKLSLVRKAVDDPNAPVTRLDALAESVVQACIVQSKERWIFQHDTDLEIPLPYLVTGAIYNPSAKDTPASVVISLAYHSKGGQRKENILYYDDDMLNKTTGRRGVRLSELLAAKGYGFVDENIKDEYLEVVKIWEQYMDQVDVQFLMSTTWLPNSDGEYWQKRDSKEHLTGVSTFKAINDISAFSERGRDSNPSRKIRLPNMASNGDEVDVFDVPIHPYLYMFNLETHNHMWVPVTWISPYQYDTELINHLIIPQPHKDLVNLLVSNPDTLKADFVKGKSGGTIIMAKGSPGTGKTMTAEAFSERAGVPLYRVQSDQLGVTAKELEINLKTVFSRAQRWKSILLIDEIDIYVHERGTDIEQNAIVGTLLRTLEYFSGVIFMTTNRDLMIDDAVLSRCSATLHYSNPGIEDALANVKQYATLFDVKLPDEQAMAFLETLFEEFNANDKTAGGNPISPRTIKNLLRLIKRLGHNTATADDLTYAFQYLPA